MESLVFAILFPASIRRRVRYSIGGAPTVSLSLSAKIDRDMPARRPNSSTVQSCAGSSCIDEIAVLIKIRSGDDRLANADRDKFL
jgi:hypothetical protein